MVNISYGQELILLKLCGGKFQEISFEQHLHFGIHYELCILLNEPEMFFSILLSFLTFLAMDL